MEANQVKPDGRHLRVERNRSQIIDAMLALIRETGTVPTADAIAKRAEVSRRSVFRLFEDRASLLRMTFERVYAVVTAEYPFPDLIGLGPHDRLCRLVDYVVATYEYTAPYRRVSESLAGDQSLLNAERDRFQGAFGASFCAAFRESFPAAAASDQIVRDSLHSALSWSTWSFLRFDRGRSIDDSKAVMLHTASTILVAAGAVM